MPSVSYLVIGLLIGVVWIIFVWLLYLSFSDSARVREVFASVEQKFNP